MTEGEPLFSALSKMTSGGYAVLPVVDTRDPKSLRGIVGRSDILSALNRVMTTRDS